MLLATSFVATVVLLYLSLHIWGWPIRTSWVQLILRLLLSRWFPFRFSDLSPWTASQNIWIHMVLLPIAILQIVDVQLLLLHWHMLCVFRQVEHLRWELGLLLLEGVYLRGALIAELLGWALVRPGSVWPERGFGFFCVVDWTGLLLVWTK